MNIKPLAWTFLIVATVLRPLSADSAPTTADLTRDFPFAVKFELGASEFAPGDVITISEVRGSKETITTGETYVVMGTYTMASRDEAEIALFITTPNSGATQVDPKQRMRIRKGSGTFHLIKAMTAEGFPHISFYPVSSGNEFGGVYFGQGDWVLREKGLSSLDKSSAAGANEAIYGYLGDPVTVPARLDEAYTRNGLTRMVELAARNAQVSLQSVQLDDSEFPFVIGTVCAQGDFDKLVEQLKKMKEYEYGGSVGSHTHHAFNLVPYRIFPAETSQRISRRLTLRQQILFDKIITQK